MLSRILTGTKILSSRGRSNTSKAILTYRPGEEPVFSNEVLKEIHGQESSEMSKVIKDLLYLKSKHNLDPNMDPATIPGSDVIRQSTYLRENRSKLLKIILGGSKINIDKFVENAAQTLKKKGELIIISL